MQDNISVQDELSLAEVFKILWRKIFVLVIVLIGGIVFGAGLGAIKSVNVHYYGASLDFYVNPTADGEETESPQYGVHGAYGQAWMDTMTKLLNTQMFAEKLLLDEDGLPLEKFLPETENRAELDAAIATAKQDLTNAQAKQDVLDLYRETSTYKKLIPAVMGAVSYTYTHETPNAANGTANSFIYVNLSVRNNEDFAKDLLDQLTIVLPAFVIENMTPPSNDYTGTNCQLVTTLNQVSLLNGGYTLSSIVKYGLVAGAISLVLGCVIVVIVERNKQNPLAD